MPFKPNYRMQRNDRERAKEQKLQKKLERRAEKNALRKAQQGAPENTAPPGDEKTGDES